MRPKRFERALALAGMVIILAPIFLVNDRAVQVSVVLVGLVMVQVGVWGVARELMPDARRFMRLREETEAFLEQVRTLNEVAVEGQSEDLREHRDQMREQVDRIVDAAGRRHSSGPLPGRPSR